MPLPIKDRAKALNKSHPPPPLSSFVFYDWIILNLFMVVFQPLGRLGYPLDWIDSDLEIETLYLVYGPNVHFGPKELLFKNTLHMFRLARISISSFRYQASPE